MMFLPLVLSGNMLSRGPPVQGGRSWSAMPWPFSGKGMLIVFTDVKARDERDFNEWYNREHIDERVNLPGFHRARRYVAVRGAPKYLATYECDTVEDLATPGYLQLLANQTPWTQAVMARFTSFQPPDLARAGRPGARRRRRRGCRALRPRPARAQAAGGVAAGDRLAQGHRAPRHGGRGGGRERPRGRQRAACTTRAWTIRAPTRPNGWCCWKAPTRVRWARRRGRVQACDPEEIWRFGGADDRHLSAAVRQSAVRHWADVASRRQV